VFLPPSWESTQIRKCNAAGYTGREITHVNVLLIDGIDVSVEYIEYFVSEIISRVLRMEIRYLKE